MVKTNAQPTYPLAFQQAPLEFCNKPQIHGSYIAVRVVLLAMFEQTLLNSGTYNRNREESGE